MIIRISFFLFLYFALEISKCNFLIRVFFCFCSLFLLHYSSLIKSIFSFFLTSLSVSFSLHFRLSLNFNLSMALKRINKVCMGWDGMVFSHEFVQIMN